MYPYNLQNNYNNNKKKEVVAGKEVKAKAVNEYMNMRYHMNGNMDDEMNGEMHHDMNGEMHDEMNGEMHDEMNGEMHDDMNGEMHDDMNGEMHHDMNGEKHHDMNGVKHHVDEKILELIKEGMQDEVDDAEYYRKMQSLFQNEEDKSTIRRIGLDEKKHKKMLDQMYTMLSGKVPPNITPGDVEITRNVLAELHKRIAGELEGVEYYRTLHLLLEDQEPRDMAFVMMVDENIHAIKLTHLYSKYK